ncbi:acetyl-CoA C-acetyltransferase [Parasphingorhabdus marina DSM 22363]|uniref:Acetyl-CoA C-acetyltransferase n=1 Tax=Parasphingorhabdus marina DSM 22363 TaxID=1123272 RepID=A0A1N6GNQ5_9SPHN|nr:acetyl-CoA acetyltransferase [Parasphingorhabdus marina]SIO09153.1 acetyl-CoA C-acetyltransferase [Parasphingorhabdus marina DSM 22363]
MSGKVYVLGGHQTDFAQNWTRENLDLFDLFSQTVRTGLEKTRLDAKDIDVGHVGNFVAELFTGQGMLGGFFGHVHKDFSGMPSSRHEGACASGSLAILGAMADIESGRYDLACVAGVELMRNVSGQQAADNLGAAIYVGEEGQDATYIWPAMFSDLAEEYDRRYGLNHDHLMAISETNFANARRNPNAQTRSWEFTEKSFTQDDQHNPVIEGWMRKQDCGQVSDGAAVVFLASEARAKQYADTHGIALDSLAQIKGWGHTTAPMLMRTKLQESANDDYVLPWTRKAITDAYRRSGISGPDQLDAIETHDCFSVTEYMAIEHFGITAPGEAWKAVEEGVIGFDGRLPVNPSGGLIGMGHPVGATGVRMMLDAMKQVTGTAGDYQVEGARNVGTFNVGGSGTTNCSFVVGV